MQELNISEKDIGFCIANALDLIDPALMDHNKKVASFALSLAEEVGLSREDQDIICLAGLLHDAGAFSLVERFKLSEFDVDQAYAKSHCELGFRLFNKFEPFSSIANMIRYHHTHWDHGRGTELNGNEVPPGSHIIFLADRISVLTKNDINVLEQIDQIIEIINDQSDLMFKPDLVDAFNNLSSKTSFWLNATSTSSKNFLVYRKKMTSLILGEQDLFDLTRLFCHLIDFRSRFTATHSSGVSSAAASLARFANFSPKEISLIRIAGYLHDIGKLVVPVEILEKPDKLNRLEFNIIKSHAYYSYHLIDLIPEFSHINEWASFHHERLDGKGYPYQIAGDHLGLGSRIMAVADVFTALTEDRPYRSGLSNHETLDILKKMSIENKLDGYVVELLMINHDEVYSIRSKAQKESLKTYQEFRLLDKAA